MYLYIVIGGHLRYLRYTQCSILLHIMDMCFLTCICLWISHIQSCVWVFVDITRFYEEQRHPSSGFAWPAFTKHCKSGPHCWGRDGSTQFAQQFVTPLVCCVVWSRFIAILRFISKKRCEYSNQNNIYDLKMDKCHFSCIYINQGK